MRNLNLLIVFVFLTAQCLSAQTFRWNGGEQRQAAAANDPMIDETGYALFYADYFEGNPTALGETYRHDQMTAAHPKLPLGTIVKVTRMDNGRSTTVRINDRGAYCDECVIDLSRAAAQQIGLLQQGRAKVHLTVMGFSKTNPPTPADYRAPAGQLTARTPAAYNYTGGTANAATQDYQTARSIESTTTVEYRRANTFGHDQIIETYQVQEKPAGYDYMGNAVEPENRHNYRPAVNTVAKGAPTTAPGGTARVGIITEATGAYAVQLGSYGEFANAERHVLALQEKGFNGVYVLRQARAEGGVIHRVIVTPFANAAEAKNYLADLRRYHQMEGIVVTVR